jgi:succinate dehydrogenase/fumarate reductase cytochrome b subunit
MQAPRTLPLAMLGTAAFAASILHRATRWSIMLLWLQFLLVTAATSLPDLITGVSSVAPSSGGASMKFFRSSAPGSLWS